MTHCPALIRSLVAVLTLIGTVTCPAADSELPQAAIPSYGYEVVSRLRFDRTNFTQGLEIFDIYISLSKRYFNSFFVKRFSYFIIHF